MAFPTGIAISEDNLNSGADDPSLARADLLQAIQVLNQLIASQDQALGVPVLNGSGQLLSAQFPNSFTPSGALTLAPADAIVKIEDVLRLQIIPKATVLALTGSVIGDVCLAADDLTGANPKLAMYDGTNWKYLALSSLTTLT